MKADVTTVVPFTFAGELYFGNIWNDALRIRTASGEWQPPSSPAQAAAFYKALKLRERQQP